MNQNNKNEKRKCWYNPEKECHCAQEQDCIELVFANAKLLYCNDSECMFNISLPYKYEVYRGRGHKPFADDFFTGVCGRDDVGMARQVLHSGIKKGDNQKFTSCRVRADKSLNRPHFPDPDKIEHTVYDDPKSSDFNSSAFGKR